MAGLSLQLWSIHDKTQNDFFGSLEKVASMGYDGVEFAGFFGKTAKDLKNKLDSIGLRASGAHIGINEILKNTDEIIEYNKIIGNKYIIVPSSKASTKEEYEELHEKMILANDKLKKESIILGFHNHSNEFKVFGDKYAFDIIVGSDLIYETDVFWSENAKINTLGFLKRIGTRCPLVHLKDMNILPDGSFEDIPFGFGKLNHKEIINTATEYCKPDWFVIEWEGFGRQDSFEAAEQCIDNLKNILLK